MSKWVELDSDTFQAMFDTFQREDENELIIKMQKSNIEDLETTFSQTALEDLISSIQVFVNAKLLKHWEKTKIAPAKIQLTIKIDVDE